MRYTYILPFLFAAATLATPLPEGPPAVASAGSGDMLDFQAIEAGCKPAYWSCIIKCSLLMSVKAVCDRDRRDTYHHRVP
ncbi:hypothetical protein N7456_011339 [Penicillium angulare]|uniref:Uncharacterized protein n=1 Tax=Penicillium angulare TaxID=116970 RepID=A0A9W9ETG7_9EURO|nr:hypothetical protein N7456_011339 [Penicillium angulare]